MTGWDAYETMVDAMGTSTLLYELALALPEEELLENMRWIARMFDIDLDQNKR